MTSLHAPRTDYSTEYRLDLERKIRPLAEIAAEAAEHLEALRGLVEGLRGRDEAIASLEGFLHEIGHPPEVGEMEDNWDAGASRLCA